MPRTFRSKTLAGKVRARGRTAVAAEVCLLRTRFCLPWTGAVVTSACVGGELDLRSYRRRLVELKSDLRDALTEVEFHEKDIARPAAQAARLALDELEDGLSEILEQVRQEKQARR